MPSAGRTPRLARAVLLVNIGYVAACLVIQAQAMAVVILIPWSAVNLADYFLVRRGVYDVASFFTAHGAYGRFAWRGLLAYAVGLAADVKAPAWCSADAGRPLRIAGLLCQNFPVGELSPNTPSGAASECQRTRAGLRP